MEEKLNADLASTPIENNNESKRERLVQFQVVSCSLNFAKIFYFVSKLIYM